MPPLGEASPFIPTLAIEGQTKPEIIPEEVSNDSPFYQPSSSPDATNLSNGESPVYQPATPSPNGDSPVYQPATPSPDSDKKIVPEVSAAVNVEPDIADSNLLTTIEKEKDNEEGDKSDIKKIN